MNMARRSLVVAVAVIGMIGWSVGSFSAMAASDEPQPTAEQGVSIFDVTVTRPSFNPSRGETVTLLYSLSAPADVTVRVYDSDRDLVALVTEGEPREAGSTTETWDGKDTDGRVVPDEAYFFTIEAHASDSGSSVVYDPITFSGGEPYDLTEARFDRGSGTLAYRLPQPSRVLVRIGIKGSAMLKTLVDWEPRVGGEITEYWDGKDEDKLIDVWEQPFATLVTYFTLPAASVITYGNGEVDYLAYKSRLTLARAEKPDRPMTNARQLSPHFLASRLEDRTFRVDLEFPGDAIADGGVPVVGDKVNLSIDVDEEDRAILGNQQFEIIVFIDTIFHAEEERGYVPYTFPIELHQLSVGEHVITVNLASFDGRIGVASARVRVER